MLIFLQLSQVVTECSKVLNKRSRSLGTAPLAGQDFGLATVHDFGPGTEQHKVPFVSPQSGGGPAKEAGESVSYVGGRPHFQALCDSP